MDKLWTIDARDNMSIENWIGSIMPYLQEDAISDSEQKSIAVEKFNEYYEEYCGAPILTGNGEMIQFMWKDPDDPAKKHICTIYPANKKAIIEPIGSKKTTIKLSGDFIEWLKGRFLEYFAENSTIGEHPFKQKKKEEKLIKITTIMINKQPEASDTGLPKAIRCYFYNEKDQLLFDISANYYKKKQVYIQGNSKYKKNFGSVEEAMTDALKLIFFHLSQGRKAKYIEDPSNGTKYNLVDLEQELYREASKNLQENTDEITLPVFDPDDSKQVKNFFNAIKNGDIALVRQYLDAGITPCQDIMSGKNRLCAVEEAIKSEQPEILREIVARCYNYEDTGIGSESNPFSIFCRVAGNYGDEPNNDKAIEMLLEAGYDIKRDSRSILLHSRNFKISESLLNRVLNSIDSNAGN